MTNFKLPVGHWGFGHWSFMGARSSESNPQALWLPSQKGRFADWPQRQSAMAGLSVASENWLPWESTSVNGPSITKGPLGLMRIRKSDMERSAARVPTNAARRCPPWLNYLVADSSSGCRRNSTRIHSWPETLSLASFCWGGTAACCWRALEK
jgi:hypothetical protein